ncbi:MAG: glycosidase, partial [Victivallaceae bacterium]|nr:glycosidase [Victivallaceae bacterium]
MFEVKGEAIPNLPWQERSAGDNPRNPIWRYANNPIIGRHGTPDSNSIFNSAAVSFGDGFAGVFRVDNRRRELKLHFGRSTDGINWTIDPKPLSAVCAEPECGTLDMGYDPRCCKIGDRYIITFCNCTNGPTIGIGYTTDFKTLTLLPNAFVPFNRNGVMFPRLINGKYAMLNRPSDNGHTQFGDIYYSESPDLEYWGHHRHVMSPEGIWQGTK